MMFKAAPIHSFIWRRDLIAVFSEIYSPQLYWAFYLTCLTCMSDTKHHYHLIGIGFVSTWELTIQYSFSLTNTIIFGSQGAQIFPVSSCIWACSGVSALLWWKQLLVNFCSEQYSWKLSCVTGTINAWMHLESRWSDLSYFKKGEFLRYFWPSNKMQEIFATCYCKSWLIVFLVLIYFLSRGI